jgi:tetratricopeptide (TPR) repeat protein
MSVTELLNKAKVSFKKNLIQESKNYLNKVFLLEKDNVEALNLMGIISGVENNLIDVRIFFNKAIKISPNNHILYFNFARILSDNNFDFEAINYYSKAVKIFPNFKEAYNNYGNSLSKLGNFSEAINFFDKAIDIDSKYFDAIYNKSLCQLKLGDFKNGLNNYEARWKRKNAPQYCHAQIPRLVNLKQLKKKSLIIFSEQGLGDCIQFSRYIFKILDLDIKSIVFEVDKKLKNLISFQFNRPNLNIIEFGEIINQIDFQIPLLSLPFLFKTRLESIPLVDKYFSISKKKIDLKKKIKLNNNKINIAIACSAKQKFSFRHKKDVRLNFFLPLLEYSNLFLIQDSIEEEDNFCLLKNPEIKFIGKEINDFEDMGAVIENMDLVITVDTVFAHLAGALGKKTFLLLGDYVDWRWLLNINNSIWYNSLTLFRKKEQGQWEDIFKEIIKILPSVKKNILV